MSDYAVHNPNEKPLDSLPVIYGLNNGGQPGFMHGQLIAEDGTALGSHLCSGEYYMLGDLGIHAGTRRDRHEHFRAHYPDGYRMDFVSYAEVPTHTALQHAFELNRAQEKPVEEAA